MGVPSGAKAPLISQVSMYGPKPVPFKPRPVHFTLWPLRLKLSRYSYRSATTGSTFMAARAGMSVAARATTPSSSATAIKLAGS
jgi:hypothetical protein